MSLAFAAAERFRTLLLCIIGSVALVSLASIRACAAMPLALAIGIPANLTYGYVVLLAQDQASVRDVWLQVCHMDPMVPTCWLYLQHLAAAVLGMQCRLFKSWVGAGRAAHHCRRDAGRRRHCALWNACAQHSRRR